jgi:hypothetical protein
MERTTGGQVHSFYSLEPLQESTTPAAPRTSTCFSAWNYDEAGRELQLKFTSGDVRTYMDIPRNVARAFEAAPSKGTFYREQIAGKYRQVSQSQKRPARSDQRTVGSRRTKADQQPELLNIPEQSARAWQDPEQVRR